MALLDQSSGHARIRVKFLLSDGYRNGPAAYSLGSGCVYLPHFPWGCREPLCSISSPHVELHDGQGDEEVKQALYAYKDKSSQEI